MATSFYRESAKIYAFPTKAQRALGLRGDHRSALEAAASRLPKVEYGTGWYHDAAIQEAQDNPKR